MRRTHRPRPHLIETTARPLNLGATRRARFVGDPPLEGDGFEPSVPRNFFGGPFDPHAIRRPQYEPARLATGSNPSLSSRESRANLWPADHAQVKPDRKHLERVSRAPGGRAGVGAGSRARSWRGSG